MHRYFFSAGLNRIANHFYPLICRYERFSPGILRLVFFDSDGSTHRLGWQVYDHELDSAEAITRIIEEIAVALNKPSPADPAVVAGWP